MCKTHKRDAFQSRISTASGLIMERRLQITVEAYIRIYFGEFAPTDIIQCIFAFYLLTMDTNILSSEEQMEFLDSLFLKLCQQTCNKDMKSINTELLFSASKQGFTVKAFLEACTGKGPSIIIIHNEHDRVFGAYTSLKWGPEDDTYDRSDPDALLFLIRPEIKYFAFKTGKEKGEHAVWSEKRFKKVGIGFGSGADVWMDLGEKGTSNGCQSPSTWDFKPSELSGKEEGFTYFDVKDCEVFLIDIVE